MALVVLVARVTLLLGGDWVARVPRMLGAVLVQKPGIGACTLPSSNVLCKV